MNTIINILAVIGALTVVASIPVLIIVLNALVLDEKERLEHEK